MIGANGIVRGKKDHMENAIPRALHDSKAL